MIMDRVQQIAIPAGVLRGFETGDDATREWLSRLPSTAEDLLRKWDLRPEGAVRSGEAGVVVPVRRADGTRAALKVQMPRAETRAAILGLTRWNGRGSVQLLDSDADQGGMLLERLNGDNSLEALEDDDNAIRVIGGLLARLHRVPPPDGLPHLGTVLAGMIADAPAAMRVLDSDDQARLDRWVRRLAEVEAEPGPTRPTAPPGPRPRRRRPAPALGSALWQRPVRRPRTVVSDRSRTSRWGCWFRPLARSRQRVERR